jgi:hypothetical protein
MNPRVFSNFRNVSMAWLMQRTDLQSPRERPPSMHVACIDFEGRDESHGPTVLSDDELAVRDRCHWHAFT